MNLKRLFNKFHPLAPKYSTRSIRQLIEQPALSAQAIGSLRQFDEAETVVLDTRKMIPVSNEDYILDIDQRENTRITFTPRTLYELNQPRVLGPDADIISCNNIALTEFTPHNGVASQHSLFYRRRFSTARKLPGISLNLVTPHARNYYHWLLEALPNIRACDLDEVDQLIIPPARPFHRQSLEILGVRSDSIIELQPGDSYQCEKLLVGNYQRAISPAPQAGKWVRESFGKLLDSRPEDGESSDKFPRRIYISRADGAWRGIANEQEVIKVLSGYGFQSVTLSQLNFIEQANLFSNASHIISAHGAGLANMIFTNPGTRVLEIFPPRWTSLVFAHLAQQNSCEYSFMIAHPLGRSALELEQDKKHVPLDNQSQASALNIPLDKLSLYVDRL